MELFDGLYNNFLRFFSWEEISFLFTGTGALIMVNLVLSEGLLSFDNALVLAILVSHLPKDKYYQLGPFRFSIQQWALTAGIFGAYFFRVIAIGLGTYLIQFWSMQLIGGSYLLWLAYEHFFIGEEETEIEAAGKGFWGTVIKVELMDIAFSIDSILAAMGISKRVWVILLGGMLGILFMRFVAGIMVRLIESFPLLKHTGYALITLIGYRLVSEVDWIHFKNLFIYLGPPGIIVLLIFVAVIWGTSHIKKGHLQTLKSLIKLFMIVTMFCWSGNKLHLHMSDLVFGIVMLVTFVSTFLFNPLYVRKLALAPVKANEPAEQDEGVLQ
jgi:YkoY family integral membrane protein